MNTWLQQIDPPSRNTLRWTARRAGMLFLIGFCPWMLGLVSMEQAVASLPLMFSMSAIIAIFVARMRRQPVCGATLNAWDEALAFNGVAALTHAVHRLIVT